MGEAERQSTKSCAKKQDLGKEERAPKTSLVVHCVFHASF